GRDPVIGPELGVDQAVHQQHAGERDEQDGHDHPVQPRRGAAWVPPGTRMAERSVQPHHSASETGTTLAGRSWDASGGTCGPTRSPVRLTSSRAMNAAHRTNTNEPAQTDRRTRRPPASTNTGECSFTSCGAETSAMFRAPEAGTAASSIDLSMFPPKFLAHLWTADGRVSLAGGRVRDPTDVSRHAASLDHDDVVRNAVPRADGPESGPVRLGTSAVGQKFHDCRANSGIRTSARRLASGRWSTFGA